MEWTMTKMKIQGHGPAVKAATWLKNKGWQYTMKLSNNNPFSAIYDIGISNREQAMIFKLTFGEEIV
jgi:hypothetical protein